MRLAEITSSSLSFRDDCLKGKESPAEKRKSRSKQNRCRNDQCSRSNRLCACLLWRKRHEEVLLTTVRSAGRCDEGWSARAGLRGAKPRGAQTNTDRPARVWQVRDAS